MINIGVRNKKTNQLYKKIYFIWYNMMKRCYDKNSQRYEQYGGSGVRVCDRWHDLDNFIEDIDKIKGFDLELFLDGLIYLDKDKKGFDLKIYSLETCSFISKEENNKFKPNQQKTIIATSPDRVEYKFFNQSEFAKQHLLRQNKISECVRGKLSSYKGWKFKYL